MNRSYLHLLGWLLFSPILVFAQSTQHGCLSGNCATGTGLFAYPDGSRYQGQFQNHQLQGEGTWFYPNGTKYEGQFEKGLPHGAGTLYFPNTDIRLAGHWVEGEFVSRNRRKVKLGCIQGNCRNGRGSYVFLNGDAFYQGSFSEGVPHGNGTCYYANGNVYKGDWRYGHFHGIGELHLANGTRFEGEWTRGHYRHYGLAMAGKSGAHGTPDPKDRHKFQYPSAEPTVSWRDFPDSPKEEWLDPLRPNAEQAMESPSRKEETDIHPAPSTTQSQGFMVLPYAGDEDRWSDAREDPPSDHTSAPATSWDSPARSKPEGRPSAIEMDLPPTATAHTHTQPKVWAVVVGISNYHHMPTLRYTDDDAYRIFAFLKSPEGGALPDEQIRVLVDDDATKQHIIEAMMEVFYKAGPRDMVMLYFSGHGLRGSFLPFDFNGYANKLYHHEINDILQNSPANFKLCIADACHSGSLLSTKGGEDVTRVLSNYYDRLAQMEAGSALLMSSKSDEISLESSGLRQGVFTHYLIKGLKGAADLDRNKAVSLQELYHFVSNQVQQYTQYRQTPLIKGEFDETAIISVLR